MCNNESKRLSQKKGLVLCYFCCKQSIVFAMLWLSMVLLYGVICAHTNQLGQDEFYRFIFFMRHPVVMGLNCLALLIAVVFSITWCSSISQRFFCQRSLSKSINIILLALISVISVLLYLVIVRHFR